MATPTQAQIEEYIGVIIDAGIAPKQLGNQLIMLGAYSEKMIAEATARIARSEGQVAQQQVEATVQAAEAAAAAADKHYLDVVKQLAAAG